jgi:hypothetical protein
VSRIIITRAVPHTALEQLFHALLQIDMASQHDDPTKALTWVREELSQAIQAYNALCKALGVEPMSPFGVDEHRPRRPAA